MSRADHTGAEIASPSCEMRAGLSSRLASSSGFRDKSESVVFATPRLKSGTAITDASAPKVFSESAPVPCALSTVLSIRYEAPTRTALTPGDQRHGGNTRIIDFL